MKAKVRKPKITARKHNGDDCYSWAVFVNGVVKFSGLSKYQVPHYKQLAAEGYAELGVC